MYTNQLRFRWWPYNVDDEMCSGTGESEEAEGTKIKGGANEEAGGGVHKDSSFGSQTPGEVNLILYCLVKKKSSY